MFPPFEEIQSNHSHGDIVIWPLKALCDYLEDANDGAILHQQLPYVDDETFQPTAHGETILQHVDRMLLRLQKEFLPGLALPRYGEGDWDDSLQPADPALRARMVSSWTAELMYQTLVRYSSALKHFGESKRAAVADELAERLKSDFHRWMMPDGVVAGFAVFDSEWPRAVEYLLHPRDTRTGLRYRLIPATRGILSGLFSIEQARRHLDLIREHLLFPDGARLMDRPTTYHGGSERTFRRSESAAFFGREIGLMYVHGQLRYAEALAVMGCADDLWRALQVVNPIAVTQVAKNASARQRNCYFSSSDAAYRDRYEASQRFDKLRRGEVSVEGGWRIYSSGPGIFTSLIIRNLLGLRRYFDWIEFDPVLPRELDGATCEIDQFGHRICYRFSMAPEKGARKRLTVNGVLVSSLEHVSNSYRSGAVRVRREDFLGLLNRDKNVVHIENC
jgi:CRISPR-associated protein Csx3